MSEDPAPDGEPTESVAPAVARSGVQVARQALAAARAEARRRGSASAGPGSARAPGAGGSPGEDGRGRRSRWRGPVDEVRSGPRPDDRDPQQLSRAVDRLVSERGWELGAAVGLLLGDWERIVGAEIAAHAHPEGLEAGVLTLRASSSAWATQLRHLAPELRSRIDADLGSGVCTAIRVLAPAAPTWQKGRLSVRGRGPRDTYG